MSLREYSRKRRFEATPEPAADAAQAKGSRGRGPIFVVQLHHASHRHYDLRLEIDGALKSWAVPKGPSMRLGERRLAVEVEDHPLSYASFEGRIPSGQYGSGHVQVFDHGTWSIEGDPLEAIAAGKLDFTLHGDKLKGGWKLVRTKKPASKPQWLLFKRDDPFAGDVEADDLVDAPTQAPKKTPESAPKKAGARVIRAARPSSTRAAAGAHSSWKARATAVPGARAKPLPSSLSPQLCVSRQAAPRGDEWLHEIKWDGYRFLARVEKGKAVLRTRNGHDWTAKFPTLADALVSLPVSDVVIDGEIVALDSQGRSDFSALQRALKSRKTDSLSLLAFDLVGLEGIDLSGARLLDRKELLEALVAHAASPVLAYSKHIVGHGEKVFEASKGQGVEGIISKRIDAHYVQSRSDSWVKIKHEDTDEFIVVGYTKPKGSRSGFGSLLMARRQHGRLEYVGRVGTGYDDSTLKDISGQLAARKQQRANVIIPTHATISERDVHWVKPDLVAEVAFRGWGKEGLLRQAAFKRLREDKDAREVSDGVPGQPPAGDTVEVRITHPERTVYTSAKVSKGEVAEYYRTIAPLMLGELANRPLSLVRCPGGAEANCFFQKHYLESLGAGVKSVRLKQKDGDEDYIYVDDAEGLLALVQMNTLEFHPWGSRIDAPELPDRMVFDLDPDEGISWPKIVAAARDVRARLRETGLESFVRLTGGKGLHVVAPINRGPTWMQLKHFCESFAQAMVAHRPHTYVATMSKAKRTDRIFIDWLRNARGSTSVTSWSLRARPGAPVAVPLRWEDLGRIKGSNAFDLRNAAQRAKRLKSDPWADIYTLDQTLLL